MKKMKKCGWRDRNDPDAKKCGKPCKGNQSYCKAHKKLHGQLTAQPGSHIKYGPKQEWAPNITRWLRTMEIRSHEEEWTVGEQI